MEIEYERGLSQLVELISGGISSLNFKITFSDGMELEVADCAMRCTRTLHEWVFEGHWQHVRITWTFARAGSGWLVHLHAKGDSMPRIASLSSLIIAYVAVMADIQESSGFDNWFVPVSGDHVAHTGLVRIGDLSRQKPEGKACGVFRNASAEGILLAAVYPLSNLVDCSVRRTGEHSLQISAETQYTPARGTGQAVLAETFWLCTRENMREAMRQYAGLMVQEPAVGSCSKQTKAPVGWNSWDYYFRTVTYNDMVENMASILQDPILAQKIKYIVVDDGWCHTWGEWQANYKFPGGMENLAREIISRGFIPGIWTAPIQVEGLSLPAMRNAEILIKDEFGDPQDSDVGGHYMVDPTHPGGREFIREIFTRLHGNGYRLFKVDFVNGLKNARYFHQEGMGPYDAIRELFRIIRGCVGPESHIIGCSLPEECGSGVADSGRTGIDIHNQWTHVEWVVDSLLHNYWLQGRVWINDPDFLIVRGSDTSLEKETNVMNPKRFNPNPQGFAKRWRQGPVFQYDEARTWTNLVILSGGSVFLSDRIAMLNRKALELIYLALEPSGTAAEPLDPADEARPSFWLQTLPDGNRLGVINWSKEEVTVTFDFTRFGVPVPDAVSDFWGERDIMIIEGRLHVVLNGHASILMVLR